MACGLTHAVPMFRIALQRRHVQACMPITSEHFMPNILLHERASGREHVVGVQKFPEEPTFELHPGIGSTSFLLEILAERTSELLLHTATDGCYSIAMLVAEFLNSGHGCK